MTTRVAAALSGQEVASVGRASGQGLPGCPAGPAQCILQELCEKRSRGFSSEPLILWSHRWFLNGHRASRLRLRVWTRGELAQGLSELLLLHV